MFSTQVEMVVFDQMGSRSPLRGWHWLKHTPFNEKMMGSWISVEYIGMWGWVDLFLNWCGGLAGNVLLRLV